MRRYRSLRRSLRRLLSLDVLSEAIAGVASRPLRAALTSLGTALGVAVVITTLGLSSTAGAQIVRQLDDLATTSVDLEYNAALVPDSGTRLGQIPTMGWDTPTRLQGLAGVVAAASFSNVQFEGTVVSGAHLRGSGEDGEIATLFATSSLLLEVVDGELAAGRYFDEGHSTRADPVAVLGLNAARRLGITRLNELPAIWIEGKPLTVIGIVGEAPGDARVMESVLIPDGTAERLFGLSSPLEIQMTVKPGMAGVVADAAPYAALPRLPEAIQTIVAPDALGIRNRVVNDVDSFVLAIASVAVVVAALGVANSALVSVGERTSEIGLRRATGARRRHVAIQFLVEAAIVGVVGGMVGSAGATWAVIGIAEGRGWLPVLDSRLLVLGPALGAAVGLVAGLYPALKAATVEPIAALRGVR